ncbi:hypothetical protein V8B97DRAFT_1926449 [Scleroderma yunnanense]
MSLRLSVVQTAQLFLHQSRHLHATALRASVLSTDLFADMGLDKPRPVAPDLPPRGPFEWTSSENPVAPSRLFPDKNASKPPKYHFHAHFTPNNTKIFLADPKGRPIPKGCWSGGSCGFKGVNRSSQEAGYQCAVSAFQRIDKVMEENGPITLAIHLRGFGKGRTAVEQIFLTSEGDKFRPLVVEVEDRTHIKIGGTRAKKARRL